MYREQFLRRGIVSVGLLMYVFFWNAGVRAQSPEAPLLPMNVEFRYVPQYLEESISEGPLYARIEALLDENGCDVILLEKSTNREAFYSISKRRVDAQAANGRNAYITPIGFTAFSARFLLPRLSFTFRTGSVTRSSGSSPSARLYRTLHQGYLPH